MSISTSIDSLVASIIQYGQTINTKKLNAIGGKIGAYSEVVKHLVNTGAVIAVDASLANVFDISLSATVKLSFINVPTSDSTNSVFTSYSVTLAVIRTVANAKIDFSGLSINWQDGIEPDQATAVNKTDVFIFTTEDGGATWYGYVSGTNR